MTWLELGITYAVWWWLVLFMVLPFGAAPEAQPTQGHARSAPARLNLRKKLKRTTLLALIPTACFYLGNHFDIITFRS
jgi:predicted secreted protein